MRLLPDALLRLRVAVLGSVLLTVVIRLPSLLRRWQSTMKQSIPCRRQIVARGRP
jgi:hypothetical protein